MASEEDRERRRMRRRNHIVKDLRNGPYHQRVIPNKRKYREPYLDEDFEIED